MKTTINQNGNAIWFILLTVALLGFLTAMISRNTSSVDQTGNVEQNRIRASSLLQYSKAMNSAVQSMLLGGVSENDLDFVAIGVAHDNTNCSSDECEVFNAVGGGLDYSNAADILNINAFANDWLISTGNRIGLFGCDTASHGCRDLILLLKDVPEDICLEVNKIMKITNPSGNLPQQQFVEEGAEFTGSYSANTNNRIIGGTNAANEAPQVESKEAGCIEKFDGTSAIYFYQVLVTR